MILSAQPCSQIVELAINGMNLFALLLGYLRQQFTSRIPWTIENNLVTIRSRK
jgi:hypothetical protein